MRTNEWTKWTNKQTTSTNLSWVCVCGSWNVVKLLFSYLNAEHLKFSIHEMTSQNGSFPKANALEKNRIFIPFDTVLIRYSNHLFDVHEHSCTIIDKKNYANCLISNESQLKIFSNARVMKRWLVEKSLWRVFFVNSSSFIEWMNEW